MFHRFRTEITAIELPGKFNNPFRYRPHRLAILAASEVRRFVAANHELSSDAASGKMFGVLVVRGNSGETGYLAAFSGLLGGRSVQPFFVPPVYDILAPDGYFKHEEADIVSLNEKIEHIVSGEEYCNLVAESEKHRQKTTETVEAMKQRIKEAKMARDARRAAGVLSNEEEEQLLNESRFLKAELKRLVKRCNSEIHEYDVALKALNEEVDRLRNERRERSAALQQWLFEQFVVFNARGERKSLLEIFSEKQHALPPAGSGECAAPKLLQYAYLHGYTPLCMAEFWIGESPSSELRRDGCFYGSCKGKCEPILNFMLQGVDVEGIDPLVSDNGAFEPSVIFEDDYLMVVDKPHGILSVPGLTGGMSMQEVLSQRYNNSSMLVAHRLDMATSGLLVVAKSLEAYKAVQTLFAERKVVKRYIAMLDGVPAAMKGRIKLPIAADYMNRPRCKVDFENGKESVTDYEVISIDQNSGKERAVVVLYPLTGRTHQLRVHCAHSKGLDTPIVGDELYGVPDVRMMLHAFYLEFVHPFTGETVIVESPVDFCSLS